MKIFLLVLFLSITSVNASWFVITQAPTQQEIFIKYELEQAKEFDKSQNELQKHLLEERKWREMNQTVPDLNKVIKYNSDLRRY